MGSKNTEVDSGGGRGLQPRGGLPPWRRGLGGFGGLGPGRHKAPPPHAEPCLRCIAAAQGVRGRPGRWNREPELGTELRSPLPPQVVGTRDTRS